MPGGDRWFASVPVHDRRVARECGPGRRAGVASEVVELIRGAAAAHDIAYHLQVARVAEIA
jgi:hypothetical protein